MQWSPDMLRQILRDGAARHRPHRRLQPRALHPRAASTAASSCRCRRAAWFRRSSRSRAPAPEPGSPMAAARPTGRRSIANDHIAVPPDNPAYTLRRVWLTEEEYKGYYYGFANEGLWPLCHIAFTRPDLPGRRLGMLPGRQPQVRRRRASRRPRRERPVVLDPGLSFRAAAAADPREAARARSSSPSGTFPGRTRKCSASARGARRSSTACSAARSSASTSSSTATTSSRASTASWNRASTARTRPISYGGETTLVHPYPISIEWPEAAPAARRAATRERVFADVTACPPT